MCNCHQCNKPANFEDLRDVGHGNTKYLVCDDCYERYYEGQDDEDDEDNYKDDDRSTTFPYVPGDPYW